MIYPYRLKRYAKSPDFKSGKALGRQVFKAKLICKAMSTIILVFMSLSAWAASDKVCEDLHRFSCAPGTYNDGTGLGGKEAVGREAGKKVKSELVDLAREQFKKKLKDKDAVQFRKMALSGTGLVLNDQACKDAVENPSDECVDLMSDGLTDLAVKKLLPVPMQSGMYGGPSMRDEAFILESAQFKEVVDAMLEKTKSSVKAEETDKKIREKVFPKVQALLLKKIETMVDDEKTRKMLTDKVKAIRYTGSDCSEDGRATIAGILVQNAMYNSVRNSFKYCAGSDLSNNSEFKMVFTIAHELSHGVDPCGVGIGPTDFVFSYKGAKTRSDAENMFPFKGVAQCLRRPDSIGAISSDELYMGTPNPYGMNMGGMGYPGGYPGGQPMGPPNGVGQMPGSNPYGQQKPSLPFKGFCNMVHDQITESFADWMAAEILPDYIAENYPNLSREQLRNGYSNVWRGECTTMLAQSADGKLLQYFDVHPETEKRNNTILLVNPKIRQQMGCSATLEDKVYCAVVSQAPNTKAQPDVKTPEATR